MKKLIVALWLVAGVSLAALLGAFLQESSYIGRAELTQRLIVHDKATAELLGEVGTPLGEPQRMIIDDPSVVLPERGPKGERLVDDAKLQQKRIYPLQEKTVRYVAGLVKMGSAAVAILAVISAFLLGRKHA
jgi:hypothetical protein